jgi:hypothetical protein
MSIGKLKKWFVGHPDAILFLRISPEGVFQHPQAITPFENWRGGSLSVTAIFRQQSDDASGAVMSFSLHESIPTFPQ